MHRWIAVPRSCLVVRCSDSIALPLVLEFDTVDNATLHYPHHHDTYVAICPSLFVAVVMLICNHYCCSSSSSASIQFLCSHKILIHILFFSLSSSVLSSPFAYEQVERERRKGQKDNKRIKKVPVYSCVSAS